jgi:hypothetical protein
MFPQIRYDNRLTLNPTTPVCPNIWTLRNTLPGSINGCNVFGKQTEIHLKLKKITFRNWSSFLSEGATNLTNHLKWNCQTISSQRPLIARNFLECSSSFPNLTNPNVCIFSALEEAKRLTPYSRTKYQLREHFTVCKYLLWHDTVKWEWISKSNESKHLPQFETHLALGKKQKVKLLIQGPSISCGNILLYVKYLLRHDTIKREGIWTA